MTVATRSRIRTARAYADFGTILALSGGMDGSKGQCRILVAEDEASLQKLLVAAIRRRQLDVETVADGVEAIACLQNERWNILLLDLMMPTLSGWDVIAWLAKNPQYRPESVIVVTAADRTILREIDPSVVNAIIFKPFDIFSLGAYLKAACELSGRDRRRVRIVT